MKTNENDGLVDNETIGILKNCSISEAAKIFVGDMLFVKIKNDNGLLVKKITYAKLNDQLHFIFEPFRNIIYGSIDDVNYDFLGVFSLGGDNNDGSENIIPNSFRLIDRSRCKIKTKIDEISKSIKTVYKAELVLDLEIDSSSVLLNIPLDIIEAEAFNSHYVAGIHLGNKQAFIADNKGGGVFKIEDDTSDM